jgi:hypothetical protein
MVTGSLVKKPETTREVGCMAEDTGLPWSGGGAGGTFPA